MSTYAAPAFKNTIKRDDLMSRCGLGIPFLRIPYKEHIIFDKISHAHACLIQNLLEMLEKE